MIEDTSGIMNAIEVEGLNHYYQEGSEARHVLKSISLQIPVGRFQILSGPSGCGKTTLLTILGGVRAVQVGNVKIFGHQLAHADSSILTRVRRTIGFIFQSHNLVKFLTASENIMLVLEMTRQVPKRSRLSITHELLSAVGLYDQRNRLPGDLSGGQCQRVAIARALATSPRLILADEPTASLDATTSQVILELLTDLSQKRDLTILMSSHDQRIYGFADEIVAIDDGRIVNSPHS